MKNYLEKDHRGRYIIAEGQYAGEFLDDVAVENPKYLRKLLQKEGIPDDIREAIRTALQ